MNDKERRIFVLQLTVACLEYAEKTIRVLKRSYTKMYFLTKQV